VPDTDFCPPEPTQTVFKGETLWDWIPVAEYLYNWMRFNVFDAAVGNPFAESPKTSVDALFDKAAELDAQKTASTKAVEQFLNPAPAGTDDLPF
jgi:hypothetical protein